MAVIIEPINPPVEKPTKLNTKPSNTAPITPNNNITYDTKSSSFHYVASEPASAPIVKNITKLFISMVPRV